MANHKSSLKRIRQTETRRLHNRYYAKTMRNAVRKLRAMTDKTEATAFLPKVQTMLDKLAKNNIIHKNKAANIKSSVTLHVNSLGWSLSARKHIAELRKEVRFFVFIGLSYYRQAKLSTRDSLLISVRFVFLVHSKTIYLYHEHIEEKLLFLCALCGISWYYFPFRRRFSVSARSFYVPFQMVYSTKNLGLLRSAVRL